MFLKTFILLLPLYFSSSYFSFGLRAADCRLSLKAIGTSFPDPILPCHIDFELGRGPISKGILLHEDEIENTVRNVSTYLTHPGPHLFNANGGEVSLKDKSLRIVFSLSSHPNVKHFRLRADERSISYLEPADQDQTKFTIVSKYFLDRILLADDRSLREDAWLNLGLELAGDLGARIEPLLAIDLSQPQKRNFASPLERTGLELRSRNARVHYLKLLIENLKPEAAEEIIPTGIFNFLRSQLETNLYFQLLHEAELAALFSGKIDRPLNP